MHLHNQQRLLDLRRQHAQEVRLLSAHDPLEFERLAGRGMDATTAPIGSASA